ncbi:hypothetical protein Tsubulata_007428 [Turnera subulata]|uniref:TF-B3 domain-containing protein n=1 Tax=Turnera subulata TaxID=218843 RepID=A0A9Q0F518_9ROSI|nr:hypothetical protein Tsubulata_007428 [Turnera subulata]
MGFRRVMEMGEENCEDCRSWEENMYWTHFQCIRFTQFLPADFDQKLAIPKRVTNNLRKKLPDIVTLKGPSGVSWKVGVTTVNDTCFLSHGWKEFVKDHLLEVNDFLIFEYNGDSQFDVKMFDKQSMCEKAASYFVRKCRNSEHGSACQTEKKSGKCATGVGLTPLVTVVGGSAPENSSGNTANTNIPSGIPIISRVVNKRNQRKATLVKSTRAKKTVRIEDLSSDEGSLPSHQLQRKYLVKKLFWLGPFVPELEEMKKLPVRPVTEEGKNKALQLAQAAVTDDGFIVVMKQTHVYKRFYVGIPSTWLSKNLSPENQDVILRLDGKDWKSRFYYHKNRKCGGLNPGWKKFVTDNNVHEFDDETCKDCRSWEEEMYWTHFQRTHFSQILGSGFDHQLAIPKKFSSNLRKKLPQVVTLKGPSGSSWKVGLVTSDDTTFFRNGWEKFIEDHNLLEKDLLVFTYNGDSQFEVLMFDGRSLCEKEAAYFVRRCRHKECEDSCQRKRKFEEASVEVPLSSPQDDVVGATTPEKSADNSTHTTSPLRQPMTSPPLYKNTRREIKFMPIHLRQSFKKGKPSTFDDMGTKSDHAPTSPVEVCSVPNTSCQRMVTERQKHNAMRLAQEALTNEGFLMIMRPTHVSRKFFMAIPSLWLIKHFTVLEKQDVILRIEERTWSTSKSQKSMNKAVCIKGMNPYVGFQAYNNLYSLGLPMGTKQYLAKVVCSLNSAGQGKRRGGGALAATCSKIDEIFQIAAIMNALVLVGVAVGFVLLRVEAAVEESAE